MQRSCDEILQKGNASVEINLIDSNARPVPFYINGTLVEHSDAGKGVAGIGIDISYRKQLEEELRTLASTDALTGTFNRLKMEETLEHELQRSSRYQEPVSIAMFDIDHFKRVNDTFGHETGDEVLKAVAATTREQLRSVDLLSRWGGEEFMIISSKTSLEEMHTLAERVRTAIQKKTGKNAVSITASFGIGQFKSGETHKAFLKRVDDALYQAKSAGRNRVQRAG
jgi:diguanylate cyclase (GGDEF)-like protein